MLTTAPHLQVRRPSPTTAEFTVTTCPAPTTSTRILFAIVFVLRILLALSALLLLHATWPLSSPFHNAEAAAAAAAATTPAVVAIAPTPTIIAATYTYGPNGNIATVRAPPDATEPTTLTNPAAVPLPQNVQTPVTPPPPPPVPTTLLAPAWLPYALARLHTTRAGAALATLGVAVVPPSLLVPLCVALLYSTTLRIHTTESLLVLRGLGIQTSSTGGSFLAGWRAGTRFIPTEKIRDVLINEAFRGFGVRYYLVVLVDGAEDVVVVFPRLLPGRAVVEAVWRGVRGCLWEPHEGGAASAVPTRCDDKSLNGS